MTPHEQLRAMLDKVRKQSKPPTGGDGRMNSEVMNTSAIAKSQALDRSKKGKAVKTMPLRDLQLKR